MERLHEINPAPGLTDAPEFQEASPDAQIISTSLVMLGNSIRRAAGSLSTSINGGEFGDGEPDLSTSIERAARIINDGLQTAHGHLPLIDMVEELSSSIRGIGGAIEGLRE